MNTKQKLGSILFLLFSIMTTGQNNWNRISFETGYGYVSPSKLYGSEYSKNDFSGFNHFDIGVRYMFDPNFGLKLNYGRDSFSKADAGITYNSIITSAVYNVGSLFDLKRATNEKIGLLGHVGLGITFANPKTINVTEHIGTATIGLTPQVKVSERISFYGDIEYAFRFKQHYGFDGLVFDNQLNSKTGKTTVLSLGLIFYIGQNSKHADWN